MKLKLIKALLIVDLQNDFCPGGALPVPNGDKIVKNVNSYIKFFYKKKLPIFASRDWHPKKTVHFKQFGGAWPKHCVRDTKGAAFHPSLKLTKETIILSKGMDPQKDNYSAFEGLDPNGTPFETLLKLFGIKELFICGLATDYCVKSTVLDAIKAGYNVILLEDAIKGVNLKPTDSKEAMKEMLASGAKKINLASLTRI